MANVFITCEIAFITCVNSAGNSLVIDPWKEKTVIAPKRGGITGAFLKPIALGNVNAYCELVQGKIPVIGAGGIFLGTEVFEFLLAGASVVQVGTCFLKEGTGVFSRLENEFDFFMKEKGYAKTEEVIGRLC